MTSKDKILSAVKSANLPAVERPKPIIPGENLSSLSEFSLTLKSIGGATDVLAPEITLLEYLENHPLYQPIINSKSSIVFRDRSISSLSIQELDHADSTLPKEFTLSILSGDFGVSENGAVWIRPTSLRSRLALFSTEHLIVILPPIVVPTMHEAYSRINISEGSTGYFVAGPSKTADIEQNLVIGAQGARSLLVLFTEL